LHAQLPAIQSAATDYADAVLHLANHPTLPQLAKEIVDGVTSAISAANKAFFLPIHPLALARPVAYAVAGGRSVSAAANGVIDATGGNAPSANDLAAAKLASDRIYAA